MRYVSLKTAFIRGTGKDYQRLTIVLILLAPLLIAQFMTMRRLNLRIQGFPESYANEPYGEDMVVGEAAPHPPMTVPGGDMSMTVDTASGGGPPPTTMPSHDPVTGVLGSPIRSTPATEGQDPISGTA